MVARKLKVFEARFGFFDTVVAAPSQAAALQAWGTHQNLFASGEAKVSTDEAAIAAARAHPKTPLRRAVGSTSPYELEPRGLPKVAYAPKKPIPKSSTKLSREPPARIPVDRSMLDAAEKALRKLDDECKTEEARFRTEEDALEARRAAAKSKYVGARRAATSKVEAARNSYKKAIAARCRPR